MCVLESEKIFQLREEEKSIPKGKKGRQITLESYALYAAAWQCEKLPERVSALHWCIL